MRAQPTVQQLAWQDLELGMFCHFGVNTFTGREWGDGSEDPAIFQPTHLDCKQWAREARKAGIRYAILTAKHNDGFCLWPTRTTEYCIRNSPWKDSKGDVVREFVEAMCEEGILPGLYCSPWDRNASCYADPKAYSAFYNEQLRELCTNYGPLVEIWFDGAGSEGYSYDWESIMHTVHTLQPDALVFQMGDPDIRWVGNESGFAPYTLSNVVTMQQGQRETLMYQPFEVDTPICAQRWFWHKDNAAYIRSLTELIGVYYRSVGHGGNLLLNLAPTHEGLLAEDEVARLQELAGEIKKRFGGPVGSAEHGEAILEIELPQPMLLTRFLAMEDLSDGEHIRAWQLEAENEDRGVAIWDYIASGSTLGHKRLSDFAPIVTRRVRLRVLRADGQARLRCLQVFAA